MTRLKNLMKRAAKGESLVIGFLGGSITQGSLSSTPKTCYAYLVYEWWKKSFPNAAFSFVNGGIGGTTSHYGGARAWKDVLCYRPDIVTVDFSVNDDANEFFEETYEGMLRRLLAAPSDPAVVVLNNVFTIQERMLRIIITVLQITMVSHMSALRTLFILMWKAVRSCVLISRLIICIQTIRDTASLQMKSASFLIP